LGQRMRRLALRQPALASVIRERMPPGRLVEEYVASLDLDLSVQDCQHEIESLAREYGAPSGRFVLAEQAGTHGSRVFSCPGQSLKGSLISEGDDRIHTHRVAGGNGGCLPMRQRVCFSKRHVATGGLPSLLAPVCPHEYQSLIVILPSIPPDGRE